MSQHARSRRRCSPVSDVIRYGKRAASAGSAHDDLQQHAARRNLVSTGVQSSCPTAGEHLLGLLCNLARLTAGSRLDRCLTVVSESVRQISRRSNSGEAIASSKPIVHFHHSTLSMSGSATHFVRRRCSFAECETLRSIFSLPSGAHVKMHRQLTTLPSGAQSICTDN